MLAFYNFIKNGTKSFDTKTLRVPNVSFGKELFKIPCEFSRSKNGISVKTFTKGLFRKFLRFQV